MHRRMGRIRRQFSNIFLAVSYGIRGYTNHADIKEAVMALCKKKTRSNAFYNQDLLDALSEHIKVSVIILRYSDTPIHRSVRLIKDCEHEPLVIAQELGGWSLLPRVLRFNTVGRYNDFRHGCDRSDARWIQFRPLEPYSTVIATKSGNDQHCPPFPYKVTALCYISNHELRMQARERKPEYHLNLFTEKYLDKAINAWNTMPQDHRDKCIFDDPSDKFFDIMAVKTMVYKPRESMTIELHKKAESNDDFKDRATMEGDHTFYNMEDDLNNNNMVRTLQKA